MGMGKREIDYTFRASTHAEIIKVRAAAYGG